MKVLVNGGINLSELDGWWAEAYSPDLGWAIGDETELDNAEDQDARDAENRGEEEPRADRNAERDAHADGRSARKSISSNPTFGLTSTLPSDRYIPLPS